MSSMRNELEDIKSRSMRDNVLFHNIPESRDDNIVEAVVKGMKKVNIDVTGIHSDKIQVRSTKTRRYGKAYIIVAKAVRYMDTE